MAIIGAILVEIKIIEIVYERSLREGDRRALRPGIGMEYGTEARRQHIETVPRTSFQLPYIV